MIEHAAEVIELMSMASRQADASHNEQVMGLEMPARRDDSTDVAELAGGLRAHVAECTQVRLRIEDRLARMEKTMNENRTILLWGIGAVALVQLAGGHIAVKAFLKHLGVEIP